MMNNDFFTLFLLSHLIGDFVLQTDKIAKIKAEGLRGLILHCSMVTLSQVLLLSLLGTRGILAALVCGMIHFGIDYSKNIISRYMKRLQFIYFCFDQLVHIFVIWTLTKFFDPGTSFSTAAHTAVIVSISLIILTYVATVAVKILLQDVYQDLAKEGFFKKHERLRDAVSGILLFSTVFLYPVFLQAAYLFAVFLIYRYCQKRWHSYNVKQSLIKFLCLGAFGVLTVFIQKTSQTYIGF